MNDNHNNQDQMYLSGMPETIAKFGSFFLVTTMYIIYALADNNKTLTLSISNILIYLSLFWFLYELCSFVLFLLFNYFLKSGIKKVSTANQSYTPPTQQESVSATDNEG